ncbi:hypothetical protein K3495_g16097, partial [Podosphaera aphanis]
LVAELFDQSVQYQSEINHLKDRLDTVQRQIIESSTLISRLEDEITSNRSSNAEMLRDSAVTSYKLSESERQVRELNAKLSELPDPSSLTGVKGKSELFRIEDRFTGEDKTLYPSFQRQIRIALSQNKDRYVDLQSKIILIYQNLGPAPKSFLDRYLSDDGTFGFTSLEAVWEVLDVSYKNVNEEEEARESLYLLQQGNRSFGWFLAEFQRLYNLSGLKDDKSLISLMRNGVSDELRTRISQQQDIHKEYTFDEYVSLCRDCVIRLELERPGRSKSENLTLRGVNPTPRGYLGPPPRSGGSLPSPASGANSAPLGGDPMVLDQSSMSHIGPDGHITPEERQR